MTHAPSPQACEHVCLLCTCGKLRSSAVATGMSMMRWLPSSREERLQGCCSECCRHRHTVLPHVRCTSIVNILPISGLEAYMYRQAACYIVV